ncbi:MAG: hypothetical protein N2653_03970, partial [Burkholderiales bacterium]|nr:hypothetical protein [Burkholderiales bacterium]
ASDVYKRQVQGQEDPYLRTLQSLVEHAQELEQTVSALTEKVRRLERALAEKAADASRQGDLKVVK